MFEEATEDASKEECLNKSLEVLFKLIRDSLAIVKSNITAEIKEEERLKTETVKKQTHDTMMEVLASSIDDFIDELESKINFKFSDGIQNLKHYYFYKMAGQANNRGVDITVEPTFEDKSRPVDMTNGFSVIK